MAIGGARGRNTPTACCMRSRHSVRHRTDASAQRGL